MLFRSPEDKIVSWLPLYHDMGLIAALHLPLAFGIPVVQIYDPKSILLLTFTRKAANEMMNRASLLLDKR